MAGLSEQELGVLQIHIEGGNVAAIGHWEKVCNRLVELGYLRRVDKLNHEITPEGRKAAEQDENESLRQIIERGSVIGATQKQIREFAEQAAQLLARAAIASQQAVGDSPEHAVRQWANVIVNRALEILRG